MSTVNIGISEAARKQAATEISSLLASSYTLYLKTHNFHWNVCGRLFYSLHKMFEQFYQELASAVDELAERIRSLGFRAPGSYTEFLKLSSIKEATESYSDTEMVKILLQDHETLIQQARAALAVVEKLGDESTADLLTERIAVHEKNAWMLRSILQDQV